MSLSQLASAIKASPTLALNSQARSLKEQGQPVIHLGSGEPKSKVPIDAIIAATAKLTTAEIRYTPTKGIPKLIEAVIGYTEQNYGRTVAPANVCIHAGAKQAIYNLMMTLLDPGEEVIMLTPYWVSYPEIVRMLRGVPIAVEPPDGAPEPRLEDILAAVTDKTKAIITNSPNNPSGAVYSPGLMKGLIEYCEEKHIYLIMDDIYHRLIFDDARWESCYKYSQRETDDSTLIVVNGVSKAYAMTGFRIGWTVAAKDVTSTMVNVAAQNTSCPSVVQQAAAAGALLGEQSSVEAVRLTLENNCNIMMKELSAFKGVTCVKPQGTFYCLPDFRAYNPDSTALCKLLLEKALVVTVPGVEFGLEGFLRLSYCGSVNDIVEGVARIRWVLDPSAPDEIAIGDRIVRRDSV